MLAGDICFDMLNITKSSVGLLIVITLNPGDFYFGSCGSKVKTILGSCVAITMWNPQKRQGGMCHFLLPSHTEANQDGLSGKYADHAVALFIQDIDRTKTTPQDYQVKVFGGGKMFPQLGRPNEFSVGDRNIVAAKDLLKRHGFQVHSEHTGEAGHRQVMLDLATGQTFVKWQPIDLVAAI